MGIRRIRVEVDDVPGTLRRLTAALAGVDVNILDVTVYGGTRADRVVDELHLAVPDDLADADLADALTGAGAHDVRLLPADVHELVDLPTRFLALAEQVVARPSRLRAVLAAAVEARDVTEDCPAEVIESGHALHVVSLGGEPVVLHRAWAPFTPTERARVVGLIRLARAVIRALGATDPVAASSR